MSFNADSEITVILREVGEFSNRVYSELIPDNAKLPAASWRRLDVYSTPPLSGSRGLIQSEYEIRVIANNLQGEAVVADSVCEKFTRYRGTVEATKNVLNTVVTGRQQINDLDQGLYGELITVEIYHR